MSDFTGTATENGGEIQVNRGSNIRSTKTYSAPCTVEAEMKSVGYSECITMSLFAAGDGMYDDISLEIGGWSNKWRFFPGDNQGDMGSVTDYRKVKLEVDINGKVDYYVDDQLKYTTTSTRQFGYVRFIPGCVAMKIRRIKVIYGNVLR